MQALPDPRRRPIAPAAPASDATATTEFLGQQLPGNAALEHKEDARQGGAIGYPQAVTTGFGGSGGISGVIAAHRSSESSGFALGPPSFLEAPLKDGAMVLKGTLSPVGTGGSHGEPGGGDGGRAAKNGAATTGPAAQPGPLQGTPGALIRLSVGAIRHGRWQLGVAVGAPAAVVLAWSRWRRQHQASATFYH